MDTDYSPDREYVDGVLVERNGGLRPHSRVLSNFIHFLRSRNPGIFVWPAVRVRTAATRVRIPDVCVTLVNPRTDVFDAPPLVCIEILSPDDDTSRTIERLEEYAAMGVPNIWLVDPRLRKAFVYAERRLEEVIAGELRAGADVFITLAEVFDRL